MWEFETHKSDVLYLCLEDTYARIQSRLYQITDEAPPELRIATTSFQIGNGLEQQIEQYLSDFPKTKLVIIDTFQKVRDSKSTGGKSGMYAGDYDDVTALKNISDKYGIAVVAVSYTHLDVYKRQVVTGPGKIWLQSMPISAVAGALGSFIPSSGK